MLFLVVELDRKKRNFNIQPRELGEFINISDMLMAAKFNGWTDLDITHHRYGIVCEEWNGSVKTCYRSVTTGRPLYNIDGYFFTREPRA